MSSRKITEGDTVYLADFEFVTVQSVLEDGTIMFYVYDDIGNAEHVFYKYD